MRKILCYAVAFLAMAMVLGACSEKKGQASVNNEVSEPVKSKIQLNAEDSAFAVDVLGRYLNVSQVFADSAAATTGALNGGSAEGYLANKAHVDSVLHSCIDMVKQRNYDGLLSMLEKERTNIYVHPGNLIDNEIDLGILFGRMYNQVAGSEDDFYKRMLPIYEFTVTHMDMLVKMGNERHPDYEVIKGYYEVAKAHEK